MMESRRSATLGVSITLFVLASIFVALRFVSRVFVVRRVGLHDWLILVAWVCGLPPGILPARSRGVSRISEDSC